MPRSEISIYGPEMSRAIEDGKAVDINRISAFIRMDASTVITMALFHQSYVDRSAECYGNYLEGRDTPRLDLQIKRFHIKSPLSRLDMCLFGKLPFS